MSVPIVSNTHPTVPSPPQHITLKLGTSLNILKPCMGPPVAKLCTCLGFNMYWNLRRILAPCLPPDLGLIKTSNGIILWWTVIWKDIAGCLVVLPWEPYKVEVSFVCDWALERPRNVRSRKCSLTFSLPYLEPLFCNDLCLSSTMGHMAVGGKMCTACSPSPHSALTEDTHLLWSWYKIELFY